MTQITEEKAYPVRGGMNTHLEKALIPFAGYSGINNMLPLRPGFKQRAGQKEHNKTADASTEIISLHQFVKGFVTERKLYAQHVDGSLQLATNIPPDTTDGVFGTEALPAIADPGPATSSILDDVFLYSDRVRQHQIYGGSTGRIQAFVVYSSASALPEIPLEGAEYTKKIRDGLASTLGELNLLGTNGTDALLVGSNIPLNGLNITVVDANGNAVTLTAKYRKSDSTWATQTIDTDGTLDAGKTFGQTGTISWTSNSDEVPHYMFGKNLFWYQFNFSAAMSATVTVSECTSESDFSPIQNVWDGIFIDVPEAVLEDDSAGTKSIFPGSSITLNDMSATGPDYLYFSSTDPSWAAWFECGATPNTAETTGILRVEYWNGDWVDAEETDLTDGFRKPGYMIWGRKTDEQKRELGDAKAYAYWYRVSVETADVSETVTISIQTLPYFDIGDYGELGNVNAAWKERMTFASNNQTPEVLISGINKPMVLNGFGFKAIRVGDGRSNEIKAMKNYFNELVVFQEEKGVAGGCITLIEGSEPNNYGRLLLSTQIGILNSKCAVTVDGILAGTKTDFQKQTLIFWISRYGVFSMDGLVPFGISDDIQNYFDPLHADCIRKGYEDKHWISHDSVNNVIVIGLVSGSSAEVPNVFLQYDYADALTSDAPGIFRGWSTRTYGQAMSCVAEIEAGSGEVEVLLIGGGASSGKVYQLNTGISDFSTDSVFNDDPVAIDAFVIQEFTGQGKKVSFKRELYKLKVPTTVIAEKTLNATAAVSADGGAATDITVTAHGYLAGWTGTIAGTINYDGSHILTIIDDNTVRIPVAYVAETFAGTETIIHDPQIVRTVAVGGNSSYSASSASYSMLPEVANDSYRRLIKDFSIENHHLSIKLENNQIDEELFLFDVGYLMDKNKASV